jgi:glycosyltransferase involved in cell wall biosynthesis
VIHKSDVLVVVPALNESQTIGQVVRDVVAAGFNVAVVDDGSTDNTSDIAKRSGAEVISLAFNLGVGGALRCGFRFAVESGYSAVIQCDADGQHLSMHLDDLLESANLTGADMVVGSRFLSSATTHVPSLTRRFAMWCLAKVAQRSANRSITDSTSGFRLIRQPLLSELAIHLPTYYLGDTFETVVVAGRSGYHIEEISVAMAPRVSGQSSASSARSIMLIGKALTTVLLGIHFRIRRLK